jgi:hypothetical protein
MGTSKIFQMASIYPTSSEENASNRNMQSEACVNKPYDAMQYQQFGRFTFTLRYFDETKSDSLLGGRFSAKYFCGLPAAKINRKYPGTIHYQGDWPPPATPVLARRTVLRRWQQVVVVAEI